MDNPEHIATLEEVLDRVAEAARGQARMSVEGILDAIGQRSFGPVLLLIGLIVLAPLIGDIPGVPTLSGIMVFLLSTQLLLHRTHFWLPRWVLVRSVRSRKLLRAIELCHKPARYVDRLVKPRLTYVIRGYIPTRAVALCSMAVALMMPLMEFIPFSANLAGLVLTLFGLALIGRDGLVALLAFALTGASGTVVVYGVMGLNGS